MSPELQKCDWSTTWALSDGQYISVMWGRGRKKTEMVVGLIRGAGLEDRVSPSLGRTSRSRCAQHRMSLRSHGISCIRTFGAWQGQHYLHPSTPQERLSLPSPDFL